MNSTKSLRVQRARRQRRARAKIEGTTSRPRFAVFRTNRFVWVQLIDDNKGATLASASSRELAAADRKKPKVEQARLIGALIAQRAQKAGVLSAVFDRRSYRYHGRVKAVAEGARHAGLSV